MTLKNVLPTIFVLSSIAKTKAIKTTIGKKNAILIKKVGNFSYKKLVLLKIKLE